MAKASIPVDLFNPGQVFACMGFLEAANVLLGNALGRFEWSSGGESHFQIWANGVEHPVTVVLEFLANAQVRQLAPNVKGEAAGDDPIKTFPTPKIDWRALPLQLEHMGLRLDITHWCDGSSRNAFKLFAGQQRSNEIAKQMLNAIRTLWSRHSDKLIADPFSAIVPLGGSSFKFDPRKSWTGIDAGYSPDEQSHDVQASPVVEVLAALGLEHARPDEFETRNVRYGVWGVLLPPLLARPALAGVPIGVPMRVFQFTLDLAGKNKIVTFAQEETI